MAFRKGHYIVRLPLSFILYLCTTMMSNAASFDCKTAVLPLDQLICSTPKLSEADADLGSVYKALVAEHPDKIRMLRNDERIWLESRVPYCSTTATASRGISVNCLLSMYADRIAYLDTVYAQPNESRRSRGLQTIYRPFSGTGISGMIIDAFGNLYGTNLAGGRSFESSVFKLAPPSKTASGWTMTTLYSFARGIGDGNIAGLVLDKSGNLYGTAGTIVFELMPSPAGHGNWSERTLAEFPEGVGGPNALTLDPEGDLLATSDRFAPPEGNTISFNIPGLVFELKRPRTVNGRWIGHIIYAFQGAPADGDGPSSGLLRGADGTLYGVTRSGGSGSNCSGVNIYFSPSGCGTVFQLGPPSAPDAMWREEILYNFNGRMDGAAPNSPLIMGKNGALYGLTAGGDCPQATDPQVANCGIVFELDPPSQSRKNWTERILHRFTGSPDGETTLDDTAPLTLDDGGNLYGTTPYGGGSGRNQSGTIFELTRPLNPESAWQEKVLYRFTDNGNGGFPAAYGLVESNRAYIGATLSGGYRLFGGTVYEFTP
jgi:uncharacterized protein